MRVVQESLGPKRCYQLEQPSAQIFVKRLPNAMCSRRWKWWETVETVVNKVGLCGRWWGAVVRGALPHHTGNTQALESALSSCGGRIYIDNILKPESWCDSWWPGEGEGALPGTRGAKTSENYKSCSLGGSRITQPPAFPAKPGEDLHSNTQRSRMALRGGEKRHAHQTKQELQEAFHNLM